MEDFLYKFFLFYLPLLFSLCVHEYAHGWMSKKFGDFTAFYQGRLTLNPLAHMDFLGTLVLPLGALYAGLPLFGWAKPVPVDEGQLKNPKNEMFWIAFAGPLSNLILSFIGALLLILGFILLNQGFSLANEFVSLLKMFIYVNFLLGIFNLIPLHPLDGGKILSRFLPAKWSIFMESQQYYSSLILILFFILGGFHFLAIPVIFLTENLIQFSYLLAHY